MHINTMKNKRETEMQKISICHKNVTGESRMPFVKDENELESLPQSLPLLQHQVQAISCPPCSLWDGEGGERAGRRKGQREKRSGELEGGGSGNENAARLGAL